MPELPSRHRHLPLHRHRGQHRALGAGSGRHARGRRAAPGHPAQPHRRPPRGLYKTIGDGTQAAFASAEDALRAARRRPTRARWPKPGPIRRDRCGCAWRCMPESRAEPQDGDYLAACPQPVGASPRRGARRADSAQQHRCRTRPRGPARGCHAEGARRVSAARHLAARGDLSALPSRAASRLPAAQHARAICRTTCRRIPRRSWDGSGRWRTSSPYCCGPTCGW